MLNIYQAADGNLPVTKLHDGIGFVLNPAQETLYETIYLIGIAGEQVLCSGCLL